MEITYFILQLLISALVFVGVLSIPFWIGRSFIQRERKQRFHLACIFDTAEDYWNEAKQRGGLQPMQTQIYLKSGETCFFSEETELYETRSVRKYVSGHTGFRIAKGVYVGGSQGRSESHNEWKKITDGTLVVTNQRLIFNGREENRAFKIDRVISVENGPDYIEVSVEGRQKSLVFLVGNPLIAMLVIRVCTQIENPERISAGEIEFAWDRPKEVLQEISRRRQIEERRSSKPKEDIEDVYESSL